MIFLIALATFASTLIGGFFALKFRDKLHLVLGFSAGAVIAVALFDLLPEALELGEGAYEPNTITLFVALGFIAYLILDRTIFFCFSSEDNHEHGGHLHAAPERGTLGAASLAVHSFLDGLAIGLAFQVSPEVGAIVAIAVLAHDFSDGINTVNLILKNKGNKTTAYRWLLLDAVAPLLGATSTLFFTLPAETLAIILSVFAGFFLYIGASDLIPESHHGHPKFLTTAMTVLGMAVMFAVISLAGV